MALFYHHRPLDSHTQGMIDTWSESGVLSFNFSPVCRCSILKIMKLWHGNSDIQGFENVGSCYIWYIYRIWIDNFIYKTLPLIVSIVVIYHSYVYHNYIPLIVGWNLYSFQTWLMISTDYVLRFQGRVTKFASQIARQSAPARAEWWPCWGLSSHGIMITVL